MIVYHSSPTLKCVTLEVTHVTYSPSITHGLAPPVLEVLDFYAFRNSTQYPPNTYTECCKSHLTLDVQHVSSNVGWFLRHSVYTTIFIYVVYMSVHC